MKKLILILCLLSISACASKEVKTVPVEVIKVKPLKKIQVKQTPCTVGK